MLSAGILLACAGAGAFQVLAPANSTPGPDAPEFERLASRVEAVVLNGLGSDNDPWYLAHACLAVGDRLVIDPDREPAPDHLIRQFGDPTGGFRPHVDPHGYSFVAELARAPVRLDVRIRGTTRTRRDFLRATAAKVPWSRLDPVDELAWPLGAAHAYPEIFRVPDGIDLAALTERAFEAHERQLAAFLGRIADDPDARPTAFLSMPCGGRHLLFALVQAASSPSAPGSWTRRCRRILAQEQLRTAAETRLIALHCRDDRALRLSALADVYGHHVEVFGYAAWRLDDADLATTARLAALEIEKLLESVRDQQVAWIRTGARTPRFAAFYGGLCHARAGLRYLAASATRAASR